MPHSLAHTQIFSSPSPILSQEVIDEIKAIKYCPDSAEEMPSFPSLVADVESGTFCMLSNIKHTASLAQVYTTYTPLLLPPA